MPVNLVVPVTIRFPLLVIESTTRVEIEAVPTTSKLVSGEDVLMPTLLFTVSTEKTLVSTLRFPETDRVLFNVEAPVTVRVDDLNESGFNVMPPTRPWVLVTGSWKTVGVCLWNSEKESLRLFRSD